MNDMDMLSTAFNSGDTIPDRFTCRGLNISPPLEWDQVPPEAGSLVLIMDDPDAPSGLFVHWVLYNIPPELQGLPEGITPDGDIRVGRSSFGQGGYGGPCPPKGGTHRYYFRLYALDQKLDLGNGATRTQVVDAMQKHILAQTELMGLFGR
jgi:hypothetical protein